MTWQEEQAEWRRDLAAMLEEELRPVADDMCGEAGRGAWSGAMEILDRAIAIVKGES